METPAIQKLFEGIEKPKHPWGEDHKKYINDICSRLKALSKEELKQVYKERDWMRDVTSGLFHAFNQKWQEENPEHEDL